MKIMVKEVRVYEFEMDRAEYLKIDTNESRMKAKEDFLKLAQSKIIPSVTSITYNTEGIVN